MSRHYHQRRKKTPPAPPVGCPWRRYLEAFFYGIRMRRIDVETHHGARCRWHSVETRRGRVWRWYHAAGLAGYAAQEAYEKGQR